MGIVIFAIIGLIKDNSKIWSIIALVWAGILVYSESADQAKSDTIYTVQYKVECFQCSVEYTNESGGTDEVREVISYWRRNVKVKGDEYITLNASGTYGMNQPVTATIYVNGKELETKQSSGDHASVYISAFPRDVNER